MRAVALASGSNGNAVYVETADARLLLDAGVSGVRLAARARSRGVNLAALDALLVGHGHADHTAGSGVLARRHGVRVLAAPATWARMERWVGRIPERGRFHPGEAIRFGRTVVHLVPTPHDAPQSAAFVVAGDGVRLGVLTDLGHPSEAVAEALGDLDAAFVESNHDPALLHAGPYPESLKERIAGPGGHLSNAECVALVLAARGARLRTVVLAHLSGTCNTPGLARAAARPLGAAGIEVVLAPRDAASPWVEL